MNLSTDILNAAGLRQQERAALERLIGIYNNHAAANEKKKRYYEGHVPLREVNHDQDYEPKPADRPVCAGMPG